MVRVVVWLLWTACEATRGDSARDLSLISPTAKGARGGRGGLGGKRMEEKNAPRAQMFLSSNASQLCTQLCAFSRVAHCSYRVTKERARSSYSPAAAAGAVCFVERESSPTSTRRERVT